MTCLAVARIASGILKEKASKSFDATTPLVCRPGYWASNIFSMVVARDMANCRTRGRISCNSVSASSLKTAGVKSGLSGISNTGEEIGLIFSKEKGEVEVGVGVGGEEPNGEEGIGVLAVEVEALETSDNEMASIREFRDITAMAREEKRRKVKGC